MAAARSLLIVVGLTACGPASPGASTEGAASSDSTSTGTTSAASSTTSSPTTSISSTGESTNGSTGDPAACLLTTGQGSEGGSEDTTGGPVECPPIPGQPCTAPIDCTDESCGSHVSMLDRQGCPRAICKDDAECGPGEGCQTDRSFLHRPITCVEDQGTCTCTLGQGDISGVCVPIGLLDGNLPAHCASITNQADCDVFDAPSWDGCHWEPTQLHCDGQCTPGAVSGACIAFFYVGDGCFGCSNNPLGRAYRRPRAGGTEVFFNNSCGDEPYDWQLCDDGNDPLCQCFLCEFP